MQCNVKKFSYNEHSLFTSSFFSIFLLIVSGTGCIINTDYNLPEEKHENIKGLQAPEFLVKYDTCKR